MILACGAPKRIVITYGDEDIFDELLSACLAVGVVEKCLIKSFISFMNSCVGI